MDDSTFSQFSPDGVTAADVDVMLAEVAADALAEMPSATSALVDGSAREQRDRRVVQRRLSGVVRAMRVQDGAAGALPGLTAVA